MAKLDRALKPDGEGRANACLMADLGLQFAPANLVALGNNLCVALVTGWCRPCEFCEFVNNFFGRFLLVAGIYETNKTRQGNMFAV